MGEPKKRNKAKERLKTKTTTLGDPNWNNMMDFFKQNPAALMDALPTPPGSDMGDIDDVKSKKGFEMDFTMSKTKNDDTTSIRSGRSNRSNRSNISKRSTQSYNKNLKGINAVRAYGPGIKK